MKRKKKSLSVLAFLLIVGGIVITLENYQIIEGAVNLWPIIPFLIGLGFLILFFGEKKKDAALAWLSTLLISLSIFFYYLNCTSWKTLAYLWPVFLGIFGVSFLITGFFTKERMLVYFSIFFIALFLAFYFVFIISLRLWPMSLVILGITLLIIDYFNKKK